MKVMSVLTGHDLYFKPTISYTPLHDESKNSAKVKNQTTFLTLAI